MLQSARPEDTFRLRLVIKWAHACKVARENDGTVSIITYNQTPIAYQMDETANSPTVIGGQRNRCVAFVAPQRVAQQEKQIVAIIEAPIPVEDAGSFFVVVGCV